MHNHELKNCCAGLHRVAGTVRRVAGARGVAEVRRGRHTTPEGPQSIPESILDTFGKIFFCRIFHLAGQLIPRLNDLYDKTLVYLSIRAGASMCSSEMDAGAGWDFFWRALVHFGRGANTLLSLTRVVEVGS